MRQDDEVDIGEVDALRLDVGREYVGIVACIKKDSFVGDLDERGEAQSFFIAASAPKAS